MSSSLQRDLEDSRDQWPDPLTLNYNTFQATSSLEAVEITDSDIEKFWWLVHKVYGTSEYDDIVLTLNGIAHRNLLKPGMVLFFPTVEDIENSFTKDN
jgi:hypothetical protein